MTYKQENLGQVWSVWNKVLTGHYIVNRDPSKYKLKIIKFVPFTYYPFIPNNWKRRLGIIYLSFSSYYFYFSIFLDLFPYVNCIIETLLSWFILNNSTPTHNKVMCHTRVVCLWFTSYPFSVSIFLVRSEWLWCSYPSFHPLFFIPPL